MPSKHAPHFQLISGRLKDGRSMVSISKELNAAGLKTTPQELGQWLARRSKRIAAAKTLLDPDASTLVAEASQAPIARKSKVPEKSVSAASALSMPAAAGKLPDLVRSSSITKSEPSDMEKQLAKLAAQAGQTPPNNWKTK